MSLPYCTLPFQLFNQAQQWIANQLGKLEDFDYRILCRLHFVAVIHAFQVKTTVYKKVSDVLERRGLKLRCFAGGLADIYENFAFIF